MYNTFLISTVLLLSTTIGGNFMGPGDAKADVERVSFSGQVVDGNTKEALSGASVRLDGLNETVYTDFDGNFEFENLLPGKYDVTIKYPAYRDKTICKLQIGEIKDGKVKIVLSGIQ